MNTKEKRQAIDRAFNQFEKTLSLSEYLVLKDHLRLYFLKFKLEILERIKDDPIVKEIRRQLKEDEDRENRKLKNRR